MNRGRGPRPLGLILNLGFGRRVSADTVVELGILNASYAQFAGNPATHYTEAYAGMAAGKLSSRMYLSPNYLAPRVYTLYIEVNGTAPLGDDWRLNGHGGTLIHLGGPELPTLRGTHYDWSVGVTRSFGNAQVQFGLTGGGPDRDFYRNAFHGKSALTVAISHVF